MLVPPSTKGAGGYASGRLLVPAIGYSQRALEAFPYRVRGNLTIPDGRGGEPGGAAEAHETGGYDAPPRPPADPVARPRPLPIWRTRSRSEAQGLNEFSPSAGMIMALSGSGADRRD